MRQDGLVSRVGFCALKNKRDERKSEYMLLLPQRYTLKAPLANVSEHMHTRREGVIPSMDLLSFHGTDHYPENAIMHYFAIIRYKLAVKSKL